MSKEKRRVPKLRFPGFTEDWEQRKLGNLATVEMNKRIFKEQTTTKGDIPFYKIGTFGSDADSFISRELFEEYKNKYPYPNIGDILISASGSIGRTVVYNGEDAYYQDSNIVWLNHNGQIDNSFLLQFYNQVKWAGLEGSTIKRLYNKNILKTNIALPKIEEQRLIGKFFKLVDSSITLHQRKLEHLNLKKKALLQKLFPKNGERYPELRFPGFTDAWEQRKLGEYANFRRGSFPQPYGNKEWYDGEGSAPFVQVVDVGDNLSLVDSTKQRISKLAQPMSVYAEKGSVLVTLQGSIGRVAVSQYDAFIDRTILIFQGYKYKTNPYFWAYIIKNKFTEEALKAPGGTIKTITKEALSNFIILYPKFSEQEQIGSFFEKLDKLITLHQRKLEHLQLQKKALLQQMFV